jgi:predicted nuclease of predicted toxin-antitoxin system
VNFLVDAHLPRRMASWLNAAGHEAVHTLDLPNKNRTTDQQLLEVADREQRVLIPDFVDSHILNARPAKLLLIS